MCRLVKWHLSTFLAFYFCFPKAYFQSSNEIGLETFKSDQITHPLKMFQWFHISLRVKSKVSKAEMVYFLVPHTSLISSPPPCPALTHWLHHTRPFATPRRPQVWVRVFPLPGSFAWETAFRSHLAYSLSISS